MNVPIANVLPISFDTWMNKVPFSFIVVSTIGYLSELVHYNDMTAMMGSFLGGALTLLFLWIYTTNFVLPKLIDWNTLESVTQRKTITSWFVIIAFILLYLSRGVYQSSQEFLIHICLGYTFTALFHTDI